MLQNAAGARKWVADRAFEEALLQAFAHSVPSSQAMERRMKEGRGFADADGGGGVYKGKKKKRQLAGSDEGPGPVGRERDFRIQLLRLST